MPTRSLTSSDSAAATCHYALVMAGLCRISPATLSDHGWRLCMPRRLCLCKGGRTDAAHEVDELCLSCHSLHQELY